MYTASYAADELKRWKAEGIVRADLIRRLAKLCIGWPYVFGAAGEMCTVSNRKKYAGYNPGYADNIRKACPVLSGKQSACDGCQWVDTRIFFSAYPSGKAQPWFLHTAISAGRRSPDKSKHKGAFI